MSQVDEVDARFLEREKGMTCGIPASPKALLPSIISQRSYQFSLYPRGWQEKGTFVAIVGHAALLHVSSTQLDIFLSERTTIKL